MRSGGGAAAAKRLLSGAVISAAVLCGLAAAATEADSADDRLLADAGMRHTCNALHWQGNNGGATRLCPEECPFSVDSRAFVCAFFCVAAPNCSDTDPTLAFANKAVHKCERCGVDGCKLSPGHGKCHECHEWFSLSSDGTRCRFILDIPISQLLIPLGIILLVLTVVIIVTLLFTRSCRLTRSVAIKCPDMPYLHAGTYHNQVLQEARWNHHWCKVRDWYGNAQGEQQGKSAGSAVSGLAAWARAVDVEEGQEMWTKGGQPWLELMSFVSNLHRKCFVGMGMPLYYNFMLFMVVFFLVLMLAQVCLDSLMLDAEVYHNLGSFNLAPIDLDCSKLDHFPMRSALSRLQREKVLECVVLYCLGFVLVVSFARFQKWQAHRFIMKNKMMRWHAVSIRGFPESAVDEEKIKEFLQEKFSKQLGRSADNGVKLAYVSIAYQSNKYGGELHRLLDRLTTIEDVRRGSYSHEFADSADGARQVAELIGQGTNKDPIKDGASREEWLAAATQLFDRDVRKLLGPDCSNLRNAGEVFAVFEKAEDCSDVINQIARQEWRKRFIVGFEFPDSASNLVYVEEGEEAKDGDVSTKGRKTGDAVAPLLDNGTHLEVFSMRNEPVGVNWHHYGRSKANRLGGGFRAIVSVILFQCFCFGIILAFNAYTLMYSSKAHSRPGGLGSMVSGIVIGFLNWLICMFIGTKVSAAGFLRTDREEVIIFFTFTAMCAVNTVINVLVTLQMVFHHHGMAGGHDRPREYLGAIDWEERMSVEIVTMLFPGAFVPCLMWPLQGFFWPFLQGFLTLRFMRADGLTMRDAEKTLEPLPIGLAWDYQGSFTVPFLGFIVVFFVTDRFQWVLVYLAGWSFFFYALQRFNHLRMVKIAYTTSNRLDTAVLFSWGFVLGVLAAGAAHWAVRAYFPLPVVWHIAVSFAAFVLGTLLLWAVLACWVRSLNWSWKPTSLDPDDAVKATLDETRAMTLYDWANCNPVLVLKSRVQDLTGAGIPPQLPYIVGKTHAWEAWRRAGYPKDRPRPGRFLFEPGTMYHKCGII